MTLVQKAVNGALLKQEKESIAHDYSLSSTVGEVFRGTVSPGRTLVRLQEPATGLFSGTSGISITYPPGSDPLNENTTWVNSTLDNDAELIISGMKYVDSTTIYTASNSDVSGDTIMVDKAMLVSKSNAQDVANNLLAYYNLRFQTEVDFPLGQEQSGDKIAVENKSGVGYSLNTAESLSIDLMGGTVATAKLLSDGTNLVMAMYCGDLYCGEVMGVM